jgi:hypothetical protein
LNAMMLAQGGNAGIMDGRTLGFSLYYRWP